MYKFYNLILKCKGVKLLEITNTLTFKTSNVFSRQKTKCCYTG